MKKTVLEKQSRDYNPSWTEEEVGVIRSLYQNGKRDEVLAMLPRRSWEGVKKEARKIGLKRIGRPDRRGANLSKLLEDNLHSYYWMGFVSADGYFSANRYLGVAISIKDIEHLNKFVRYIDGDESRVRVCENHGNTLVEFKCGNDFIVPKIKKKFGLVENKTKNPPSIEILDKMVDEQFISWFIGFIDGDGAIVRQSGKRTDCYINIGVGIEWLEVVKYIEERVYSIFNHFSKMPNGLTKVIERKTNFGICRLAQVRFSDCLIVKNLSYFAKVHELSFLERKWGKI